MTNKDDKKFNKYERIAGAYVLLCAVGIVALLVSVVVKKGWFEPRASYVTYVHNAKDIHEGTEVMTSGLRVGWVSDVNVVGPQKIRVDLDVFEKHAPLITQGSEIAVVRAYLVGDKSLELLLGDTDAQPLQVGSEIPNRNSVDLVDFVSSKDLAMSLSHAVETVLNAEKLIQPSLEKVTLLTDSLRKKVESMDSEHIDGALTSLLDGSSELSKNMSDMGRELAQVAAMLNKQERLQGLLDQSHDLVLGLNQRVPALTDQTQAFMTNMTHVMHSIEITTKELEKILPVMQQVSPELPALTKKTLSTLDEAVIMMRAMQKSFLLRKHVDRTEPAVRP